ncbi:3-oxoacyl-[acyl-carrier protein] reductase [Variovorax paradoxus]|nr:3-oxoacyl-[acyl-carrier protein] reductase [Variovorax paradoxus]
MNVMNSASTTPPSKTALVFGGSRGIGAAAVQRLAADGYAVAFTYVSQAGKANELVASIEASGAKALAIQADSANPDAIRQAVSQAVDCFGIVNVLVVNAGLLRMGTIDAVNLEDLDLMLDVNVRGVYLAIQAALPICEMGLVSSRSAATWLSAPAWPARASINSRRPPLQGWSKGWRSTWPHAESPSTNIQPGPTRTDMTAGAIDMLVERSPLKRVAEPEEIAGLVSYLARDEARYVTGSSITIDGGLTL